MLTNYINNAHEHTCYYCKFSYTPDESYFCWKKECIFYREEEIYATLIEVHYQRREELDTEYNRSDEDISGRPYRLVDKILLIPETRNGFSGEFMYKYIWETLFENCHLITEDMAHNIMSLIRTKHQYNISKKKFKKLCMKKQEEFINVKITDANYARSLINGYDRDHESKYN